MRSTPSRPVAINLIAPCGINCAVCRAHLRARNPCPGCRAEDADKPKTGVVCKIKTCAKMATGKLEDCSACGEFPCGVLLHLDKRYRLKYATSPVENLRIIKMIGAAKFVKDEALKWTCPQCGAVLCMHQPQCGSCGYAWHADRGITSLSLAPDPSHPARKRTPASAK